MSVTLQPGYILLTQEINDLQLEIDMLADTIGEKQARYDELVNVVIPKIENALRSWQQAGNSDLANKLERIDFYKTSLSKQRQERDALDKELKELRYEKRRLDNEMNNLVLQRNAFENNYRSAIMAGKGEDEAAIIAEDAAGQLRAEQAKSALFTNPLFWVGVAVGLAAIAFIIFKMAKK